VRQVADAIESITSCTLKVKRLIDEVSVVSRQQSQGIDQASQAIARMEKVRQATAATAEESAASTANEVVIPLEKSGTFGSF
jgi:methyl-accepting chemotaxis protein